MNPFDAGNVIVTVTSRWRQITRSMVALLRRDELGLGGVFGRVDVKEGIEGYGRPIGDYRARCKLALTQMGLLDLDQIYVRPPYKSLTGPEELVAARQAVAEAGLLAVAAV